MQFLNLGFFKKLYSKTIKKSLKNLLPPKINSLQLKGLFVKKQGFLDKVDKIEVLVIGSSHGDYGFNPEYFDKASYNLCYASQDLYYSFKLYEKFYKKLPKLKNIFLFYSVFSPGFQLEKTVECALCSGYKLLFDLPYKKKRWFDRMIEKQCNKEFYLISEMNNDSWGYNNPQFFYSNDFGVENRVKTHLRENQRKTNQADYIIKLFNLAEEANHKLTVIIPPAREDYRKNLPAQEILFNELYQLVDNKFNILNFYSDEDFLINDFGDFDHLNYNGATKLTKKIKEYI